MTVSFKDLKQAADQENPYPLVVAAIQMCYEFLDMKFLDGGIRHAACTPGREALLEYKQMFEQTAKDWQALQAKKVGK